MLSITALYVGLFMLLLLVLAIGVVRQRLSTQTSMGDGGHLSLIKAMRAHGNAIEYVPVVLIGLAVLELNSGNGLLLHLYGSAFLIARFSHAFGMQLTNEGNNFRKVGVVRTWLVMLAMGVHLIARTFQQWRGRSANIA